MCNKARDNTPVHSSLRSIRTYIHIRVCVCVCVCWVEMGRMLGVRRGFKFWNFEVTFDRKSRVDRWMGHWTTRLRAVGSTPADVTGFSNHSICRMTLGVEHRPPRATAAAGRSVRLVSSTASVIQLSRHLWTSSNGDSLGLHGCYGGSFTNIIAVVFSGVWPQWTMHRWTVRCIVWKPQHAPVVYRIHAIQPLSLVRIPSIPILDSVYICIGGRLVIFSASSHIVYVHWLLCFKIL
jgi:hypothetical protein